MIVIKIASIALGLMCLLFGYNIYFKKKYHLINDFEDEYRAGRKDEQYARKIGLIEFVIGVILLVVGIILIIFA